LAYCGQSREKPFDRKYAKEKNKMGNVGADLSKAGFFHIMIIKKVIMSFYLSLIDLYYLCILMVFQYIHTLCSDQSQSLFISHTHPSTLSTL
jgi:hypothetical protein